MIDNLSHCFFLTLSGKSMPSGDNNIFLRSGLYY